MKKTLRRLPIKQKMLSDFYVFDTETGSKKGNIITWELNGRPESFIFGVIYGYNYTKIIYDLKEFKETLLEKRFKNKKVFAHNFGGYDGSVLYGNIYDLDPHAIFNGKFICCTNGNCVFADSLNIFVGQSVKKIGEALGLLKIGMSDGNYTQSNWNNKEEKTRDINGCIRDCQIVWDALYKYFEFAGDIKITQASLSLTYFRRHALLKDINHTDMTKYFWNSYYGGRCEVFKLGKCKGYVIDVNAMYPYVMKYLKFPDPYLLREEIDVNVKYFLKSIINNYEGYFEGSIFHPDSWVGFLPCKINGKLCFPIGNIFGCWNFNEIRFAIRQGCTIKEIKKIVYSSPMPSPFTKFVNDLFEQKTASKNEFDTDKIKRFMNSLYGKLGSKVKEETIYIKDINKEYKLIQQHKKEKTFIKLIPFNAERNDCFLVVKSTKNISKDYSIPSFASYITSEARIILLKNLILNKKNKVLYCDTDSIFMESLKGVKSTTDLGGWKIEEKIITDIRGLKNYTMIKNGVTINAIKGVPKKANQIDINNFTYTNLIKTKEALRRNLDAGTKANRVKKLTNKYTKRIVNKDGTTKPIKL